MSRPPIAIGREDPRLDRRRPRAERGERHGVLPVARLEVEVHPQRPDVGTQRRETPRRRAARAVRGGSGTERTAGAVVPVEPVPRLEQRVGGRVTPRSQHPEEPRLERIRRHASRARLRRGGGVARGLSRGQGDHGAIRALRPVVAVDAEPHGLEREEEATPSDGVVRASPACPRSSGDRACRPRTGGATAPTRSRRTCGRGANRGHRSCRRNTRRLASHQRTRSPTRWWERSQESDRARRRDAWFEALGGPPRPTQRNPPRRERALAYRAGDWREWQARRAGCRPRSRPCRPRR